MELGEKPPGCSDEFQLMPKVYIYEMGCWDEEQDQELTDNLSSTPTVVGLDFEWVPDDGCEMDNFIALVQIACDNCVLLVRTHENRELPPQIWQLLESPKVIKAISSSLHPNCDDVFKFHTTFGRNLLELPSLISIGDMATERGFLKGGLFGLACEFYFPCFRKGYFSQAISKWDTYNLGSRQVRYAAHDAWLTHQIYRKLKSFAKIDPKASGCKISSYCIRKTPTRHVVKGKYTGGSVQGSGCVIKAFRQDVKFEFDVDSYFDTMEKRVTKTAEILEVFNKLNLGSKSVHIFAPLVYDNKKPSKHVHEGKVVVEPLLKNFHKFNSNTGCRSFIVEETHAKEGNEQEFQPSPNDTEIVEALCHFSLFYTDASLVLCDIQGEIRSDSIYIVDPSIHSSTREFGPTDLGEDGICSFFTHHSCNQICETWKDYLSRLVPSNNSIFDQPTPGTVFGSVELGL